MDHAYPEKLSKLSINFLSPQKIISNVFQCWKRAHKTKGDESIKKLHVNVYKKNLWPTKKKSRDILRFDEPFEHEFFLSNEVNASLNVFSEKSWTCSHFVCVTFGISLSLTNKFYRLFFRKKKRRSNKLW